MKKPTIECTTQDDGTDAIEARNANNEHMYLEDVADELIEAYESFKWMYNHTKDSAIADYCYDIMEVTKKALIKAGVEL